MPHKSKYAFAESKGISQENKMSAPETNEATFTNPPSEEVESVPPQEPITASQAAEAESEVPEEKAPQVEEGEEEEDEDDEDSDYYPDDYYESQSYISHNDYYDDGYGLDWNESGYFD